MKHALNIVRKELDKIFRNPRLIFSTFILPGLLIFVIYSVLGKTLNSQVQKANEHMSKIYVVNGPDSFYAARDLYDSLSEADPETYYKLNADFIPFDPSTIEGNLPLKDYLTGLVDEGEVDALVSFEADFKNKVEAFLNKERDTAPEVFIYANSTINNSSVALSKINTLLGLMNSTKMAEIGNPPSIYTGIPVELASEEQTSGQMIGMLLPMLITVFVFAGGISVGADAIAGEKERGTISTLLMAPVSKSYIVIGKIIATIIITVLSSLGSFVGVIASFPNAKELFGNVNMISYGFVNTCRFSRHLIALIASSFFNRFGDCKTKETTMCHSGLHDYHGYQLFSDVYRQTAERSRTVSDSDLQLILGLKGILLSNLTTLNFFLIVGSTLVYAVLLLNLVRVLFKSEQLMFQK